MELMLVRSVESKVLEMMFHIGPIASALRS